MDTLLPNHIQPWTPRNMDELPIQLPLMSLSREFLESEFVPLSFIRKTVTSPPFRSPHFRENISAQKPSPEDILISSQLSTELTGLLMKYRMADYDIDSHRGDSLSSLLHTIAPHIVKMFNSSTSSHNFRFLADSTSAHGLSLLIFNPDTGEFRPYTPVLDGHLFAEAKDRARQGERVVCIVEEKDSQGSYFEDYIKSLAAVHRFCDFLQTVGVGHEKLKFLAIYVNKNTMKFDLGLSLFYFRDNTSKVQRFDTTFVAEHSNPASMIDAIFTVTRFMLMVVDNNNKVIDQTFLDRFSGKVKDSNGAISILNLRSFSAKRRSAESQEENLRDARRRRGDDSDGGGSGGTASEGCHFRPAGAGNSNGRSTGGDGGGRDGAGSSGGKSHAGGNEDASVGGEDSLASGATHSPIAIQQKISVPLGGPNIPTPKISFVLSLTSGFHMIHDVAEIECGVDEGEKEEEAEPLPNYHIPPHDDISAHATEIFRLVRLIKIPVIVYRTVDHDECHERCFPVAAARFCKDREIDILKRLETTSARNFVEQVIVSESPDHCGGEKVAIFRWPGRKMHWFWCMPKSDKIKATAFVSIATAFLEGVGSLHAAGYVHGALSMDAIMVDCNCDSLRITIRGLAGATAIHEADENQEEVKNVGKLMIEYSLAYGTDDPVRTYFKWLGNELGNGTKTIEEALQSIHIATPGLYQFQAREDVTHSPPLLFCDPSSLIHVM